MIGLGMLFTGVLFICAVVGLLRYLGKRGNN